MTDLNGRYGGIRGVWWVTLLTLLGMVVLGYHPYSEDGALYVAEIKHVIDPGMYPHGTEFVTGHLGMPSFAVSVAFLVRVTGVGLPWVLFLLYGASVWGMLYGVWLLASACSRSETARVGAVGLVAMWLTMPVAGTSLLLMDPYVTARSVSVALTLLGMAGAVEFLRVRLEGSMCWGALGGGVSAFGLAALVHPLMAFYAAVAVVLLGCVMARRTWVQMVGVSGVAGAALVGAWLAQKLGRVESAEYWRVASTRYYWFLVHWRWYEWIGLAAPVAILAWVGWGGVRGRTTEDAIRRGLSRMAVALGCISVGVAVLFAREGVAIHLVAKIQPLRCFQVVYLVMMIVLGSALGEFVLRRSVVRWAGAVLMLSGVMFGVERLTYPNSRHLELPGLEAQNNWEEAFLWVRGNTPKDALFALDPDYVHLPGEDTQGFRAIAERSVLPDRAKDGGVAAIRAVLAGAWTEGQRVQAGLSGETDSERVRALAPAGVTWIVLERERLTGFSCPYVNATVKVCRLP